MSNSRAKSSKRLTAIVSPAPSIRIEASNHVASGMRRRPAEAIARAKRGASGSASTMANKAEESIITGAARVRRTGRAGRN